MFLRNFMEGKGGCSGCDIAHSKADYILMQPIFSCSAHSLCSQMESVFLVRDGIGLRVRLMSVALSGCILQIKVQLVPKPTVTAARLTVFGGARARSAQMLGALAKGFAIDCICSLSLTTDGRNLTDCGEPSLRLHSAFAIHNFFFFDLPFSPAVYGSQPVTIPPPIATTTTQESKVELQHNSYSNTCTSTSFDCRESMVFSRPLPYLELLVTSMLFQSSSSTAPRLDCPVGLSGKRTALFHRAR